MEETPTRKKSGTDRRPWCLRGAPKGKTNQDQKGASHETRRNSSTALLPSLEREGRDTEEIYAKGLGNCLPVEIQLQLFRSVPGLEEVEVMRPAYAIEYDFVDPLELQILPVEHRALSSAQESRQINRQPHSLQPQWS